ncbi:MAG: hypothetical protein ABI640_08345 [Gammaproteobacteria bacterium]
MSRKEVSTRRCFLGHAGAALAAPLTATAALAHPASRDESARRLAMLEAASAIRALQREYARCVNAGAHAAAARLFVDPAVAPVDASLRRLAADRFATHDVIEVAPDGATATASFECMVETEAPIAGSYTLIHMLHEQGDAALRSVERRGLESVYARQGTEWKIVSLVLRRA